MPAGACGWPAFGGGGAVVVVVVDVLVVLVLEVVVVVAAAAAAATSAGMSSYPKREVGEKRTGRIPRGSTATR